MTSQLDHILEAVVKAYVRSGRPVASRHLAASSKIDISAASIRNLMALLECKGLLYKPHTSAGRIPTDKGYRYYVDNLMRDARLRLKDKRALARVLAQRRSARDVLRATAHVLGSLSGQICVIVSPCPVGRKRSRTGLSVSGSAGQDATCWIYGRDSIVGELDSIDETRKVLRMLENPDEIRRILLSGSEGGIAIGSENRCHAMRGCSIVWSFYKAGDAIGAIGLIGPKRMSYPRMVALVRHASKFLNKYFARGGW